MKEKKRKEKKRNCGGKRWSASIGRRGSRQEFNKLAPSSHVHPRLLNRVNASRIRSGRRSLLAFEQRCDTRWYSIRFSQRMRNRFPSFVSNSFRNWAFFFSPSSFLREQSFVACFNYRWSQNLDYAWWNSFFFYTLLIFLMEYWYLRQCMWYNCMYMI